MENGQNHNVIEFVAEIDAIWETSHSCFTNIVFRDRKTIRLAGDQFQNSVKFRDQPRA